MQFQPLSCIIKVPGKASAFELEIQATCKTIKPKGKLYFRINYSYQSSAFWSTGNRMIDGNGMFLFWNREFLANIQSILLIWRSGNFFDAKNTISRPLRNRYQSKFSFCTMLQKLSKCEVKEGHNLRIYLALNFAWNQLPNS